MTKNIALQAYSPGHLRWTGQVKEMNMQSVDETDGHLEDKEENWAMNIFLGACN
jgi:hypothetical protein